MKEEAWTADMCDTELQRRIAEAGSYLRSHRRLPTTLSAERNPLREAGFEYWVNCRTLGKRLVACGWPAV